MADIVGRLRFDAARCEMQFSKGVAGNITEAADEIERLRAAARLVWRWRNGKASDQEMVEAAKAALCPEQTGEQCCRADCSSEDSCMEARGNPSCAAVISEKQP